MRCKNTEIHPMLRRLTRLLLKSSFIRASGWELMRPCCLWIWHLCIAAYLSQQSHRVLSYNWVNSGMAARENVARYPSRKKRVYVYALSQDWTQADTLSGGHAVIPPAIVTKGSTHWKVLLFFILRAEVTGRLLEHHRSFTGVNIFHALTIWLQGTKNLIWFHRHFDGTQ